MRRKATKHWLQSTRAESAAVNPAERVLAFYSRRSRAAADAAGPKEGRATFRAMHRAKSRFTSCWFTASSGGWTLARIE